MVEKEELIRFIADNGFIWGPEPELYGGLSGFYTYGPYGKQLKNNVENLIRKVFTKHKYWEVECPTILPAKVWKASGHLAGFTDPLIKCSKCSAEFRVDKLLEEKIPTVSPDYGNKPKLLATIKGHHIKCPQCGGEFEEKIIDHQLMMKTTIGVDREAYNRPETATATYLPFKRYYKHFRTKLPFSVFQIGKAYRNEISPRQHTVRGREFTQAEAQIFCFKNQKEKWDISKHMDFEIPVLSAQMQQETNEHKTMSIKEIMEKGLFKTSGYAYAVITAISVFQRIGVHFRLRQHQKDEMAFYANDAWDIEVKMNSFGWEECCGVHDRTDHDLTAHAKESGEDLSVLNEKEKEVPHVIEIAMGSDRMVFAILDHFYDGEKLRVPCHLAPVKACVFPLLKNKPELVSKAREVAEMLDSFCIEYDDSGSIGRRYARADTKGVPYCITIDFDTLKDDTVTIRDRDTAQQQRVKITELPDKIKCAE